MTATKQYWLIKSEPTTYSISNLCADKKTAWTGIRNFQARNYMRDEMHIGDEVLFYHSSCKEPGVYGLAKVVSKSYPDETQFHSKSEYFEPRASQAKPVWYLVDIGFGRRFKKPLLLHEMREHKKLSTMKVLQPGNRLSITPVTPQEFTAILSVCI